MQGGWSRDGKASGKGEPGNSGQGGAEGLLDEHQNLRGHDSREGSRSGQRTSHTTLSTQDWSLTDMRGIESQAISCITHYNPGLTWESPTSQPHPHTHHTRTSQWPYSPGIWENRSLDCTCCWGRSTLGPAGGRGSRRREGSWSWRVWEAAAPRGL